MMYTTGTVTVNLYIHMWLARFDVFMSSAGFFFLTGKIKNRKTIH